MQRGLRVVELTQYISGPLDVPMADWPAEISDKVDEALMRVAAKYQCPFIIAHSEYGKNPDVAEDHPHRHYLHIIASEVVMADERAIKPGAVLAEMPTTGKPN